MSKRMTDEEVRAEIERLRNDPDVKAGRAKLHSNYKERQKLYRMRYLQKLGAKIREEASNDGAISA